MQSRLTLCTTVLLASAFASGAVLVVTAFAAIASGAAPGQTIGPTWWEHVDLMQVVIVALFSVCLWFVTRTIQKIDANQSEMFERLNTLSREFYQLQGEHRGYARIHVSQEEQGRI